MSIRNYLERLDFFKTFFLATMEKEDVKNNKYFVAYLKPCLHKEGSLQLANHLLTFLNQRKIFVFY